jgi:haloacetate dehalogenase
LIGANPEYWLKNHMGRHAGTDIFEPACWGEYLAGAQNPEGIHAMCEDYRAAATIDLIHDRADRANGKKLLIPLRVLWGEHGLVNKCFKPIQDWSRASLNEVTGKPLPCGHYIPEERPAELIEEVRTFFT